MVLVFPFMVWGLTEQQISAGFTIQSPWSITIQEMGDMILTDFKPWVSFTVFSHECTHWSFLPKQACLIKVKDFIFVYLLEKCWFPIILHTALTFSNYPLLAWKLPFSSATNLCRSCIIVWPFPSPQHHWLAVLSDSHLPASPDSVLIFLEKTNYLFIYTTLAFNHRNSHSPLWLQHLHFL